MIYNFFVSVFMQFPFQLLISESVFLVEKPRRERFGGRLVIGIALYFLLSVGWQEINDYLLPGTLFRYVLLYVGYAFLSVIPMRIAFEMSVLETVFVVAGGYATEHMVFTASRMILYLLGISYLPYGSLGHLMITRYLIYIIGATLVYVLIVRGNRSRSGFRQGDGRIALLALVLLVAAIGMSVYWSYPEEYLGTLLGDFICPAYSFLCCLLVLVMEYYVLRENNLKHERELMEQLLQMADAQQRSSKEAIDIINIKCHDLKHQIAALAKMEDAATRSEYLREVQDAVSIYDATYHTGSKALDYVLREKTLLFNERQVQFSCMADGKLVDFLSGADIYALMGNALDNALESVLAEPEEERVISLQIRRQQEMVLIHLENRCSRPPQFQDGLPITTKQDKNQHGFGVKSIRYLVEKYDGELFMSAGDGKFYLDILF